MIYIVGFIFQFNSRPKPVSGGSIQERIALAKRGIDTQKTSSMFDSKFIQGDTYKVTRILKIVENNESKYDYLFSNITNTSLPDIHIMFNNSSTADDYIAAMSGKTQQLANERNSINAALENPNDF